MYVLYDEWINRYEILFDVDHFIESIWCLFWENRHKNRFNFQLVSLYFINWSIDRGGQWPLALLCTGRGPLPLLSYLGWLLWIDKYIASNSKESESDGWLARHLLNVKVHTAQLTQSFYFCGYGFDFIWLIFEAYTIVQRFKNGFNVLINCSFCGAFSFWRCLPLK